ncbi:hypothetical protein CNMCM6936_003369 [Aspergillus lentulus]|uniref:PA14 domain-containing protein n=1 Tax=Aspergillus lentulus TaxID=293939 RepID=A0AAN5YWB6_ASPLE|nr:hypothetical protein CNMCM6069_003434 [Aspergillus lentulus]KAF4170181.1 hypothetical protein CNMCM6936_003369 [Aspergillus lentulus]KAF4183401.1 hypothetical protein CNMCM8060_003313 [Aspergillus lentulus]KAF4197578.1 hypothetical protein CNMCM8694_002480 [Aspergillus lentulus]KAF4209813.1 hypothetical protein CNMCM8927_005016 [Aspergillus lentulus]
MNKQTFLLLLGGLASLASGQSECQTIVSCKSTSTVTTTVPEGTCTPCPVPVTTAGTISGTPGQASAASPAPAPLCTTVVQPWNRVDLMWTSEHAKPGPPAPGIFSSNFDFETILTITDDYQSLERFEVYQDDQFIGKTSERGPGSTARNDVKDADEALRLGYSQGYFTIPSGPHTFTVTWLEAANNPAVAIPGWRGGSLQYRFQRVAPCA